MSGQIPQGVDQPAGVQVLAPITPEYAQILTPAALTFLAKLHRQFNSRRLELQASCFSDIFIGANRRSYPVTGQSLFQWRWLIGHVTDNGNDHGDANNHQYWATRGYNARNPSVCNTFVASAAKVQ